MDIISIDVQTTYKNSYSSSAQVKLTLRSNGEEKAQVFTPQREYFRAGIEAPTVAPTMALGAAGNVTGIYYYAYVYASSKYPFVENDVSAGGEVWPRSNPSPVSAASITATADAVTVTVTKSTRSDIDYILIYRTADGLTAADALGAKEAGELFYVGRVANDGIAGTTTFSDDELVNTGEILELDNFEAPLFRFNVFDGTYWWGFGNNEFNALCEIDGTSTVVLTNTDDDEWFSGRDGSICTFDGVISGGFDGKGSFYFKRTDAVTCALYSDAALTVLSAVSASGTTTIRIQTNPTTLYRSKPRNPFSWGRTTTLIGDSGNTYVSDIWALKIGGGIGTALSIIPNDLVLKLDTEGPSKSYALDLNSASSDGFGDTLRILDDNYSCGSNFSQFTARNVNGQASLASTDGKTNSILQADSSSQIPAGTNVVRTLSKLETDGTKTEFYHGIYDPFTELNCWWVNIVPPSAALSEANQLIAPKVTHLIYQHAPTGYWGVMPDFGVLCSTTIYDPIEKKNYIFVGTQNGTIARAFTPDVYQDCFNTDRLITGTYRTPLTGTFGIAPNLVPTSIYLAGDGTGLVELPVGHGLVTGDAIYLRTTGLGFSAGWATVTTVAGGDVSFEDMHNAIGETNTNTGTSTVGDGIFCYKAINSMPYQTARAWVYLSSADGLQGMWAYCSISGADFNVIFYVDDLFTSVTTTAPHTATSTWKWYLGLIPCRVLRYFDVGTPEKSKRKYELWASMMNLDTDTAAQFVRFYEEYDEEPTNSITMVRDKRPDGTNSNVYFNRNEVPSDLLNSFGIEFIEYGYENYQLLNFVLKANAA